MVCKTIDYADAIGFDILHLDFSPIKGPEGNIEYLVHIRKNTKKAEKTAEITETQAEALLSELIQDKAGYSKEPAMAELIKKTVDAAHQDLDK